ncbi:inter-alpha-trypsin inhibitor heavy chain H5-like [Styela clava]
MKFFFVVISFCAAVISLEAIRLGGKYDSLWQKINPTCTPLNDVITNAVTAAAISFYADHPRGNETFDPNKVKPFSPSGLFKHYYGDEASTVELKKALLQLIYSTAEPVIGPIDRDTLRRNLYSYISAGSREYARNKAGQLLRIIIDEYGETESWKNDLCVEEYILNDVLEAIEVECYRIRNEVGDTAFSQFFAFGVGSTLAFAIDDTGSMSGEIDAAKRRAQEIVRFTKGTLDAPQDFVLVPFNDPGVGPVTVTNNAEEYHQALEKLYAHGGGDAPELAMRGIQLAIENSRPGSTIYVISDVDAKDYMLQDTVVAQARQKSIVVTFMLTNSISNCANDGEYKKCMPLYKHIAKQTGGKVLVISRSDIFRTTDIVQSNAKQGVILLKQVTVVSNAQEPSNVIPFYVDSSVQEILLETQGHCEHTHVMKPGSDKHIKIDGDRYGDVWATNIKIAGNESSSLGEWSIGMDVETINCSVKIQAKTSLGFVLNVFTKGRSEPDDAYKISDHDPFVEESVGLVLDAYGYDDERVQATALKLVNEEGRVTKTIPVAHDVGNTIPHIFKEGISELGSFRVVVKGYDSKGNVFERMQPKLLSASHVKISCDLSKLVFIAGQEASANITLENFGPDDHFLVTTSDEKDASSFHGGVKTMRIKLTRGEGVTKLMRFRVDESVRDGTAIKITITAKGKNPMAFQYTFCTLVVGQKKRPRIDAFAIKTNINARFAETVVTSMVTNNADIGREAEFDILLPNDAFITGIVIELQNETIVGEIEEKKKAKKVYDKAKSRGTVAGHVAARDTSTRAFRTSMFVEPRQHVKFILTYQQLLRRVRGRYEYSLVLNPDQPIRRLTIDIHITEEDRLSFVRVLPIKTTLTNIVEEEAPKGTFITTSRHDTAAHIHYAPDVASQTKWSPKGISGIFTVEYDVARPQLFGQVSVANGYFAHFFAPPDLPPTPKIVVFVIDTSGSMYGYKMAQMQNALASTLQTLNKEDRFNLVLFGDEAEPWMKESMPYAEESTVEDAVAYVRDSKPRGGTNVVSALDVAIKLLEPYMPELEVEVESSGVEENITDIVTPPILLPEPSPPVIIDPFPVFPIEPRLAIEEDDKVVEISEGPSMEDFIEHHERMDGLTKRSVELDPNMDNYAKMIVFMTDGRPSIGETDTKVIVDSVTKNNQERFNLHTLGFGSLTDFNFLTKLAAENGGTARRVFEGLDADQQIKNFFDEVTKPVLRDVSIEYPKEKVEKLTVNTFSVFHAGSELIVAGMVRPDNDLELLGEEGMLDDELARPSRSIQAQVRGKSFDNDLEIDFDIDPDKESEIKESPNQIQNFTEKLWAFLQLKELFLEATLENNKTLKEEINAKALNMSLKYNFVTPLTSLVVLRSDERKAIEEELKKEIEELKKKKEEERLRKEKEEAERDRIEETDEYEYFIDGFSAACEGDGCTDFDEAPPRIALSRVIATPRRDKLRPRGGSRGGGGGGGGGFSGDPHFIIPIQPGINICFNWDGQEDEIYNFIYDPERNVIVNGMLVNAPAPLSSGRTKRTYVSRIGIILPSKKILITPWNVTISRKGSADLTISAMNPIFIESGDDFSLEITGVSHMSSIIELRYQGMSFRVTLHRQRHSMYQRDHLDFGLSDNLSSISRHSDGVLGQFSRLSSYSNHAIKLGLVGGHSNTSEEKVEHQQMYIRGKFISVAKRTMDLPGTQEKTDCWYIHKNGAQAMRKKKQDYRVLSIFDSPRPN